MNGKTVPLRMLYYAMHNASRISNQHRAINIYTTYLYKI